MIARWPGEVRGAISLNNETRFLAEEVDDEGAQGVLPTELGLRQAPAAQHPPELLLGGSGSAA